MRQHIEHTLAVLGALGFALFVSYFNTGAVVHLAQPTVLHGSLVPLPADHATTTFPALIVSTSTFESLFEGTPAPTATPSTTTPAAKTPVSKKPAPAPRPPVAAPPPAAATPATSSPSAPPSPSTPPTPAQTGSLTSLSGAIVNIICISNVSGLHSISGSGVMIDSRGLILTVAHVAQMFLLEEYLGSDKVSCVIRTGSPARSAYIARPVYVSEAWVKANSTTLISSQPTGTGEHDYAVLAVTGSASSASLPGAFPAASLASSAGHIGDAVLIGSYGAQDLSSSEVRTALYPTLATSTVTDRFTFGGNTVDVLAIAGTAAAQEGSSGGAVTDTDGDVIGIITTSQISGPVDTRTMRIITTGYIERSYANDTGKDFDSYFGNTSLSTLVNSYAPTDQALGQFLASAIGLSQ